ncbi:hypothetical protein [uncultured Aquitalea sp.]|uniref:hypothetical protein n=1 Tax=uncultured Aquitalea sp. TaxID=540272 RepID=UPI0025EE2980|nr:hypothetical protein [uncultured Aquitalea sp.]
MLMILAFYMMLVMVLLAVMVLLRGLGFLLSGRSRFLGFLGGLVMFMSRRFVRSGLGRRGSLGNRSGSVGRETGGGSQAENCGQYEGGDLFHDESPVVVSGLDQRSLCP